ncbi:glycosyltransferase family 25 protein [Kitasatospora sp. NPDC058190]|uniref:glycosyltransferase family 25 protein n=1 Tax=Kitasatospora sp. NPDC058190 TaxID=3346371 RepID=UPI0036DEAF01
MITSADIRAYVVNLPRRADRRKQMEAQLPGLLKATFTSDWTGPFDGRELNRHVLYQRGVALFPWQIASDNPWWNRPLKLGEIGCTLAHLACWQHAADTGGEPFILVLEDDAVLAPDFLSHLLTRLAQLGATDEAFDLLYLGRFPLEPDEPYVSGVVHPGYSHCTFGYLLTRPALTALLATGLEQSVVPIDEFLPSLYIDHPRQDLRARFPRQLRALALDPPLVRQLPKDEAGSDTEDSPFVDWQ